MAYTHRLIMIAIRKRKSHLRIRGRYTADNDITLFKGNCLRLLEQIPDCTAQLIVTSPPYNVGKSYERKQRLPDYLASLKSVIAECIRIVKPGGSICWQTGNHVNGHQQIIPLDILLHPFFAEHEAKHQIRLRNRIAWHFAHGLHCTRRFSGRYETILEHATASDLRRAA